MAFSGHASAFCTVSPSLRAAVPFSCHAFVTSLSLTADIWTIFRNYILGKNYIRYPAAQQLGQKVQGRYVDPEAGALLSRDTEIRAAGL